MIITLEQIKEALRSNQTVFVEINGETYELTAESLKEGER